MQSEQRLPHRLVVLNAILELHRQGIPVVTDNIQEHTGLARERINECIKLLKEEELIYSSVRGVYVPVEMHPPPRAVSMTMVPGGMTKLEIGDVCVDLWPRELQAVRFLMAGFGVPYPTGPVEQGDHNRKKR